MRAAGNAERAPLVALARQRVGRPNGIGCSERHVRLLPSGRPAVNEQAADEGDYQLARLIGARVEREDEALVGPAPRRPGLDDLARTGDGVARIDRFEPLEFAEAGRGTGAAHRLAARAHRLLFPQPALHDE